MSKAEIISIGTELLLGEITDTNAAYLAGQLPPLGIDLYWVSQVGDNQTRLVEVLKRAWERSDLILTTGGLGPTIDDRTRESIAELLGETPEIDPALEVKLRERFSGLRLEMPLSNLKQVSVIPSAESIPNSAGTAPGWWVEKDERILVAMPGPPRELHVMWEDSVKPKLPKDSGKVIIPRTIKIFGLSEGAVGESVSSMLNAQNPTLGIYAKSDGIHLRIAAKADTEKQAREMIAESEEAITGIFQEQIWGADEDTLEDVTAKLMIETGVTLAVMEDYSGGWLSATITDTHESHRFFKGGLVATSDAAKKAFGVNSGIIEQYGASSPEAAQAMAEAAREFLGADIGISSTGLIKTEDAFQGASYIGIADDKGSSVIGRPRRKQLASATAMFALRKKLLTDEK